MPNDRQIKKFFFFHVMKNIFKYEKGIKKKEMCSIHLALRLKKNLFKYFCCYYYF